MKHVGDITKLSGYDLPVVDVITGGSPCQDLSVAGKRAGLDGERSGLFMEQVRIVKEMREHDRRVKGSDIDVRPRWMVWENVPGAFSSNKGADFQAVLTEIVRIVEPTAPNVPMPAKGKWTKSGILYDELGRWSIAWRVHDAQFWGVPQRRKRIALVADFGGLAAPEVLFERKGMRGDFAKSGSAGEAAAGTTEDSFINAISFQERAGKPGGGKGILIQDEHVGALSTLNNQSVFCLQGGGVTSQNSQGSNIGENVSFTLNAVDRHGVSVTYQSVVGTIDCGISKGTGNQLAAQDMFVISSVTEDQNTNGPIQAMASNNLNSNNVCRSGNVVRRLTPLECERLQGFPDGWTDIGEWTDSKGKKHKPADGPRYKALGNSIALPFWFYLLRRIAAQYERPATLGSLFDGIGGFPLCWERCNGKGTAIWASEIEEFSIAVTKKHFPEEEE